MRKLADGLALIAVTLWVGGLWATGLMAKLSFDTLNNNALAGMLAGKFFSVMAYVGVACAVFLLLHRLASFGASALKQAFFWVTLVMLILTVGSHFGIQPVLQSLKDQAMPKEVMESMFRSRFVAWHGVSSVVYLIQSLLGLVLVLQQKRS